MEVTALEQKAIMDCLQGRTASYEILVKSYKIRVFTIVYRILLNREEAEDISQEVFVKAYQNLKSLDKPERFASWLLRIAHNHAVDYLKKRQVKTSPVDKEIENDLPARDGGPEKNVLEGEKRKEILRVFRSLKEEYRVILTLRYIQELQYSEIADILNIPIGTVKSRLQNARLSFMKAMQEAEKSWSAAS